MSDWIKMPLTDALTFREDPGVLAKDFHTEGVPLIRLSGLKNGANLLDGCNFLDPDLVSQKWDHFRLELGDVLLSTSASLGEVAVVTESGVGAVPYTGIIGFRPKDDRVSGRFIRFMLTAPTFKAQIEAMGVGSVMKHFGPSHLKHMSVQVPPLSEQEAIADVLGAVDDKIAGNTKLAATADGLLATRFESIIDAQTPLIRLSEIADVNRSTLKPSSGGQLRYVDIASVGVGSYGFPPATAWDGAPSRARRAIRKGDTLWSTVRPNRRSHALNLSDDPLLVGSTGLAVLTARAVGWAYLYEVTRRREFTSYLETVAEGSAYPAVRADKFGEALVPLADEASQRSFEQLAEPLREQLHSLGQENRTLATTRDALLPQLMSGKLRVKDAEKVLEQAGV